MAQLPNHNVLVLNKYYAGIHVASLFRAISLTFDGRAEVIVLTDSGYYSFPYEQWIEVSQDPKQFGLQWDNVEFVKTARVKFLIPRVIRLTASSYIPDGKKQLRPTRNNIFLRDDYVCQYCEKKLAVSQLNIDHVIPKSRGGKSIWANLVTSCKPCNTAKADQTPGEAGIKLLQSPRKPKAVAFISNKLDPRYLQEYQTFLGIS